jgi:hypothetical protein
MNQYDFSKKPIYTKTDVPFLGYLSFFVEGLRKDFLKEHPTYTDITKPLDNFELSRPPTEGAALTASYVVSQPDAWMSSWCRYQTSPDSSVHINENRLTHYPTAAKIIKELGSDLGIVLYSSMESYSVIERHTDHENRENRFLRIHIPIIIPKGDVFIEINGEEAHYSCSDIFGFNNQYVHSAHNYTKDRRLIFLIDIRREFLGLPPADCYDLKTEKNTPPFTRNGVIWNSAAELARVKAM